LNPRYWAIIAAAGGGSRMRSETPKQYLRAAGRTLIEHSVDAFLKLDWIEGIVVVLPKGDDIFGKLSGCRNQRVHTATGGASRADSILAGLNCVAELAKDDRLYVLVHDAARPCITRVDIERLRNEASDEQGGVLAIPIADTLKRAQDERVGETVDRRGLWAAQTPQLFRLDLLRSALAFAAQRKVEVTDEAAAMEAKGARPRLVPGRKSNIKVTYPEDLALAEFWLQRKESER
jgi:2-C-methyl-D-erythritol 4-phosphate cytidylyltransferase